MTGRRRKKRDPASRVRAVSPSHRPKRSPGPTPVSLEALAGALSLLSDPTRLLILESLVGGVQCNCNLKEALGLPMNLISHHLKILKEAGLVHAERDPHDARWIYYEIIPEQLSAFRDRICSAMDPARLKPRQKSCGPPVCCPPPKRTAKPRARPSSRSRR